MTRYSNSTWTNYVNGGDSSDSDCVVVIDGSRIVIEYSGDTTEHLLRYVGIEIEPGHYELTNPEVGGNATLHRFRDDTVLEGSWREGGENGMWSIELMNDDEL